MAGRIRATLRDGRGPADAETLLRRHARLIETGATRHGHRLEREDAVAICALALIDAAARYEADRTGGSSFAALALARMRGALGIARRTDNGQKWVDGADGMLLRALADVMPKAARTGLNPRGPTEAELARAAKRSRMTVGTARTILSATARLHPLAIGAPEEPREGHPQVHTDRVESGHEPWGVADDEPIDMAIHVGRRRAVRNAVRRLPKRLRELIRERYPADDGRDDRAHGTDSERRPSMADIAAREGITTQRVHQLESQALRLLRSDREVQAWT